MLSDFVKRWMDMVFWWLPDTDKNPRKSSARQQTKPAQEPPKPRTPEPKPSTPESKHRTPEPAVATDELAEEVAADGDDLTAIKGVGPAMAEKLRHMGINRFSELAAVDPEALTADLKKQRVVISIDRVKGWKLEAGARQPAT